MENVQFRDGSYHLPLSVAQTGTLVDTLRAEVAAVANGRIKQEKHIINLRFFKHYTIYFFCIGNQA